MHLEGTSSESRSANRTQISTHVPTHRNLRRLLRYRDGLHPQYDGSRSLPRRVRTTSIHTGYDRKIPRSNQDGIRICPTRTPPARNHLCILVQARPILFRRLQTIPRSLSPQISRGTRAGCTCGSQRVILWPFFT